MQISKIYHRHTEARTEGPDNVQNA